MSDMCEAERQSEIEVGGCVMTVGLAVGIGWDCRRDFVIRPVKVGRYR